MTSLNKISNDNGVWSSSEEDGVRMTYVGVMMIYVMMIHKLY